MRLNCHGSSCYGSAAVPPTVSRCREAVGCMPGQSFTPASKNGCGSFRKWTSSLYEWLCEMSGR
eukprot:2972329-Prorocentrum_lima.AAC.1